MTLEEARSVLSRDAGMADLLEAIGTITHDPHSSPQDLMLGLRHPEVIAEQAALGLYRCTGRPLPQDRTQLSTDLQDWTDWLSQCTSSEESEEPDSPGSLTRTTGVRSANDPDTALSPGTAVRVRFAAVLELLERNGWQRQRTHTVQSDDIEVTRIFVFAPPRGSSDEVLVVRVDLDGTVSRAAISSVKRFIASTER